ncbi:MAG: DUF2927 domain-containing protein [Candidatus Marinimicrobia bacterium]|nr:DUF2927 domain-containing protein [Candidatus Neomarinimicrobiota bacterium]
MNRIQTMNLSSHTFLFTRTFLGFVFLVFWGCRTIEPHRGSYTQEEIDYFLEIALGTEYGTSEATIKKWTDNIKITVQGTPTEVDSQTLNQVVDELNDIIDEIELAVVSQNPNIEIHFLPESEFRLIEPNYVPLNYGFFWVNWSISGSIYHARILISTDHVTQQERSHLIREELTQSLGLMKDSYRYPDSIFYQGWTDVTRYLPIDSTVIEILYRSEIRPNMTGEEVVAVFDLQDS